MSDTRPRPLPGATRLPLLIYRTLFPLAFLVMLPGVLLRMFRRGGYRAQFGQRFGFYHRETQEALAKGGCEGSGGWTWIHAVSVGEMMMALKLARALQEVQPGIRLLLSTTTSTGFAVAQEQRHTLPEAVEVIYYPLDLTSIVRRVLNLVRPARLVLVDKELWPNLVSECYRRNIPITIVNARISPRSERRIRKARRWVAPFYSLLTRVCLQDEADRSRWISVGVRPEALHHTGSLKFDLPSSANAPAATEESLAPLRQILTELGQQNAPILLGGSTFPGEEELLGQLLLTLRERWPDLFLIIVPRHVERTPEILAALKPLGLHAHLRTASAASPATSTSTAGSPRPDLLIVNTTGELARWYSLATLSFIGKSLAREATGGQNPAEPLFAGSPVLFGPNMQNFEPLATQLVDAGAASRVTTPEEFECAVNTLLSSPDIGQEQVTRARALLSSHNGATQRILEVIFMP